MSLIKTVIFDLDGTLIDSSKTISNAFNYALAPYNIALTLDEIDSMRALTSNEMFLDRLSSSEAKLALQRLWEYSKKAASESIIFPGIKDLLQNIKDNGLTIGLWTGRDLASAKSILEHHNIDTYFQAMVGCCGVQKNKPHPEGLHLLANRLNVDLSTMLHVGDHDHDLQGATAAGVISVLAKWRHTNQKCHELAQHSFDSIHEFDNWLNV